MSVIVQIGGYGTASLEFVPNETLEAMLGRLKEQESITFATADKLPNQLTVQKALDAGRTMQMDEIVQDEELYVITAGVQRVKT